MGAGPIGVASAFGSVLTQLEGEGEDSARRQIQDKDNAKLALSAAADAVARGNQEAGRARIQASQLIAKQQVAYANSGVDPTVGTPTNVMADTRMMSELDAKTIENNAAREAYGFRKYGIQYQGQASLEASRQRYRTASTILGGLGRGAAAFGGGG